MDLQHFATPTGHTVGKVLSIHFMDFSLGLESLTNVSIGGRRTLNLVYYTISMMGVYGVIFKLSMDAIS